MYEFLHSAVWEANTKSGNDGANRKGPFSVGGNRTFRSQYGEKFADNAVYSIHRRLKLRYPNLVVEMLCSEKLLGPLGGHATMQHMLATPGVQAGLMVKVNYPWNHTNVADNCVLLVYYTKGFSQPGPYLPTCVKVLGRALTNGEKILLQEELGVEGSNIQGNGINGCGKCWYANSNDDNVYTFTIPPSVMLKGSQDVDYVTIDGAEVKLDTLEHGLVIDSKNLMDCIVMDFYVQTTEKAELDGYFRKPSK